MYQMIHFLARSMKMNSLEFLKHTFLFDGFTNSLDENVFGGITPTYQTFQKGELIFSPENHNRNVGFIVDGECEVRHKKGDGAFVLLNKLKPLESFGIISLYSENDDYPTYIYANKKCSVLFLKVEDIEYMISKEWRISMNIIKFLTSRIKFLNTKIATFSCNTVEEKLANHILSEFNKHGAYEFEFNKKRSADAISAGRASLYRAIDSLVDRNIIEFDNKKIIIKDLDGLERMSK